MRTKLIFSIIVVSVVAVFSCKKEPEIPTGNKIEIGETTIDTISYFGAQVSSEIANTGGNEIIQHGHCWSEEEEPTTDNDKTELGKINEPKTFTSQITELNNNTKYFVRSYITYQHGTLYGTEESIQTLKTGIPVVAPTEVSNITISSAHFSSKILSDSGLTVTLRGFCWDTTNIFTITDCLDTTIVGSGLGVFNSEVSSLNEGVNYYVKAYAVNEKGNSYGEVEGFSTVPITLPEVTTDEITEITINSAKGGGNVTSNGTGTVTAIGVCWNTTGNPTLENSIGQTTDGSGTGNFTSQIANLSDGVTYYVTAYATNEKGTSYGEINQFTTVTINLPTVNTTEITDITPNTATGGGNVTSNGNGFVTDRGVCWNISGNPTLENNIGVTTDGSGTGSFTSQLTSLAKNTTYYIAAYATNEKGNAYGQVKSFLTANNLIDPRDGQTYEIVEIVSQTWMAENLNYETSSSWWYNNNSTNGDIYGRLYTWEAATIACPNGWHLPSDEEWKILEGNTDSQYGVGDSEWDSLAYRGYDVGKHLKTTLGWTNSGNGTDTYNFSALPGGYGGTGENFNLLGDSGNWWSSSEKSSTYAWGRRFYYFSDKISRDGWGKSNSLSVRCIKN